MPNPEQSQPMQENVADVIEPKQNTEPNIEIAQTPELENVVDTANVLAEKIEGDEKVTEGDVYDLREALGQMKFDIGGKMMTANELRENPELLANYRILQEMKKGNFSNIQNLTNLSSETAEFLVKQGFKVGNILDFRKIKKLSLDSLRILSKWEGTAIDFSGLTDMPKELARILKDFKDVRNLDFNGLTDLPSESAAILKDWNGDCLSFDGLATISRNTAKELSKWKGFFLEIRGIKTLDQETAKILGKWESTKPRVPLFPKIGHRTYSRRFIEAPINILNQIHGR
ncbi:MAG: hypothetical protein WC663_02400 [Patescibacteria group bacterium]|jgi:hypothetical protein